MPIDQDEVILIQEEIIQVEKMVSQLQAKRLVLLQKLNCAKSATRNLPPETLSLIFKYYMATDPLSPFFSPRQVPWKASGYLGLLTLGHVSSYWRQVLWSTPQLWTSMVVDERRKSANVGILELHLKNVGNLPFNLDLKNPSHGPWPTPGIIKSIAVILAQYSEKIRRLRISVAPQGWLDVIPKLTSLEWLSIYEPRGLLLTELLQLRHIVIQTRSEDIQLPWMTVTVLELSESSIRQCTQLLTRCPNLLKFSSDRPRLSNPPRDPTEILQNIPLIPIIFHQLQDFHWGYLSSPWDRAVFQRIRLPALSTLSLDLFQCDYQEGDEDAILTLFTNLQDTLQVLTITGLRNWTLPFAKHIFSRSSSLRKMTLSFVDGSISLVLCELCPAGDSDGATFLPFLNDLTIKSYNFTPEISCRILDICRAKSVIPGFKLRLEFLPMKLTWAPGVLEELSAMVRDRFDLNIQHSGRHSQKVVVTWLS